MHSQDSATLPLTHARGVLLFWLLVVGTAAPACRRPANFSGRAIEHLQSRGLSGAASPDAGSKHPREPSKPDPACAIPERLRTKTSAEGGATLYPVNICGRWGFIDRTGRLVIEPRYLQVDAFDEGLAPFFIGGAWNSHTDESGATVWEAPDARWGLVDTSGAEVIPARFDEVQTFSEGLAAVRVGDRWGFIDRAGNVVIEPAYISASGFSMGLAPVRVDTGRTDEDNEKITRWGFIDTTGTMVIPATLFFAEPFDGGTAMAVFVRKKKGKYGSYESPWERLIDRSGKPIPHPEFDYLRTLGEGLFAAHVPGEQHLRIIDGTGKIRFTLRGADKKASYDFCLPVRRGCFTEVESFSEGLAAFATNADAVHMNTDGPDHGFYYMGGVWGVVDKVGTIVVKPQYEHIAAYSEGLAPVEICSDTPARCREQNPLEERTTRRGYLDRSGALVLQLDWKWGGRFRGGIAPVSNSETWPDHRACYSYIDRSGNVIYKAEENPALPGGCGPPVL